jgi:hypothetical protein
VASIFAAGLVYYVFFLRGRGDRYWSVHRVEEEEPTPTRPVTEPSV